MYKDKGATSTEYALILSFIAVAIIVSVTLFGESLSSLFTRNAVRVGSIVSSSSATAPQVLTLTGFSVRGDRSLPMSLLDQAPAGAVLVGISASSGSIQSWNPSGAVTFKAPDRSGSVTVSFTYSVGGVTVTGSTASVNVTSG